MNHDIIFSRGDDGLGRSLRNPQIIQLTNDTVVNKAVNFIPSVDLCVGTKWLSAVYYLISGNRLFCINSIHFLKKCGTEYKGKSDSFRDLKINKDCEKYV